MRLGYSRSKYSISYYAQKTIYVNGKNKSQIVKWFGSERSICETYGVSDAKAWAQEQIRLMNEKEKEETGDVLLSLSPLKDLPCGQQQRFNGGYLFLQAIYHQLGLDKISKAIAKKHGFEYNLNAILSRLIYTRILYPASKKSSFEDSFRLIEQPDLSLHQIYRALSVLAEESDYIQSRLYKNSLAVCTRRTGVIYYDCTNYYFETERAEDDRQYGLSKENRPLPIVQMGLFMDADGIPLAFDIHPGNTNEQQTLIPLEKKLLQDLGLSKLIVCTDSGLSSIANRKFNDHSGADGLRAFVTTQSVKKLKKHLKDWALDPSGWHRFGDSSGKLYSILDVEDRDAVFFKDRWIKENGLEQHLIVSFSLKQMEYQRSVRRSQIDRALKAVEKGASSIDKKRQTDFKRFIRKDNVTPDGEIADRALYSIDLEKATQEEQFDGFYAVCTNLEDDPAQIFRINHWRWEIEECFRIMKSEFAARPVFVQRKDRIRAHFITCFLALTVYRFLEKRLGDQFTCPQIIDQLREMDFLKVEGKGFIPCYTRTPLTDALHASFGFNTSKEIVPISKMRNFCALTKKS